MLLCFAGKSDMELIKGTFHSIFSSKPKLLLVISSIVLAAFSAPVILPNITNTAIIYHLLLHIASVIIAIFLGVVSILAYSRNRKRRLLFMTFGFLSLSMIEVIYLVHITSNIQDLVIPIVDVEFSHLVFLVMLTFFGIGIFSASKR
jgi:hypothetical protein